MHSNTPSMKEFRTAVESSHASSVVNGTPLLVGGGRTKRAFRTSKKYCKACRERRALSMYRGKVKFRKDHPLCPRCWHSVVDSMRVVTQSQTV